MREASYPLIIPVIVLYFTVLMGLAPLSYQIHIEQACNELDTDDCDDSEVSSRASNLSFIASLSHYLPAIFTCGIYGNIADIFGRKRALLFPILGVSLWAAGYFIVAAFQPSYYFYIIIACNFCLGFSGSYMSFLMASLCYVADCTSHVPTTRKRAYSVTEASIFGAQIFAPVISGIWASYYGFTIPFLCGMILSICALIYTITLPESLPITALSKKKKFEINIFQTFSNLYFIFQYQCPEGTSPLPWVGMAFFLFFMVTIGYSTVKIVYLKHKFGWDSSLIGVFEGLEGLLTMVSMLMAPAGAKRVTSFFSSSPFQIITWIQIGYIFRIIFYILFGLAPSTVSVFLILPCLLFIGPLAPYNRTILSNSVPPEQQAQAFAAFSAIEGVSALFAPLFSALYSYLVTSAYGGTVFFLMGLFVLISFLMIIYIQMTPSIKMNLPEERRVQESVKQESSVNIRNFSGVSIERGVSECEQTKRLLGDYHSGLLPTEKENDDNDEGDEKGDADMR
jgi:MFS family permease